MRRRLTFGLLLLVSALAVLTVSPRQTFAQGADVSVSAADAINEFPSGVRFTLSFTSQAEAKEVRLRYRLAPDGTGASAIAQCTRASTQTNCSYTLTSGNGIVVIPGAEITYGWQVTDALGAVATVADKLYMHEDTRFTFQTLSQDNITLHYYSGSLAQAQAVLEASEATIRDVSALENTQVTFPVKVFLYKTAVEMQPAIAPGGVGRGLRILGEVVYSDTAMVSADSDTIDLVRHEVAHIVTGQATKGPFGIALWMNEGISVFSQTVNDYDASLQSAIRGDRVLSIKELNSPASGRTGSTAEVFYGQAGSMIGFLVDTYGREKFAELIRIFKDGSTPDKAFQAVYGFDQLGYENAWRESVGLEPRVASATSTPGATSEANGAATPVTRSTSATSGAVTGGEDTPVATIAIIIAMAGLLLAAVVGLGMVLIRRR